MLSPLAALSNPSLRKRVLGWALVLALGLAGGWGARRAALSLAVHAGVRTLRGISETLPKATEERPAPMDNLLFPLWPIGDGARVTVPAAEPPEDVGPAEQVVAKAGAKKASGAWHPLGPPPKNARASIKQVLGWAEHQIIPRGVTRPEGRGIPAGIELHGVEGLGLGLLPGDRLVTVDGVAVTERSQVVGAVLGARARRAEAMTAGLVRRTKEGPVHFTVVVEQPYPEHIPDPG